MTKIRPKTTRTSKDEERDSINKTSVNNTVLTPYEKKKNSAQKKSLQENLNTINAGLTTVNEQYSKILETLKNGGLSTVDTSVIADSKVVDSMQEDEDRNIDSRKDMVDLKEREADRYN